MTTTASGHPSDGAWLVLDTSTPIAVVGVVRGGVALAEHRLSEPKRHAEGLIDAIDRALLAAGVSLDDLVGVGVGRGPGSFIGVRTGIATAKGLCLGRSLPLVGIPSLVALACSALDGHALPAGRGLAVIDAKRGEVYAQLVVYDPGAAGPALRAVDPPAALTPDEARARAASLAFIVGGALGSGTRVLDVTSPSALGLARALAVVTQGGVVDELATLVPEYSRAPDAKLPAVDPGAHRPPT